MSLVKHAEFELKLAGLLDTDSDYGGYLGKAVLELVEVFAKQGHSGLSAFMTLDIFGKVASFKLLTPISSNAEEWTEVSEGMWQNKRCSSCFSKNGGKTWYDIDAPEKEPAAKKEGT